MDNAKNMLTFWKTYVFLLTPLLLLPLPILYNTNEALCGYGVLIMAVYWVTECLPIAVTSLLPPVLFPLMGVMSATDIARNYIKDSSFLFMGGLMVAVSIEHSELHRRIALSMLRVMGTKPRWILFGFMFPTWFLSMWISNTATTAMMLPVAEAVIQQLMKIAQEEDQEQLTETLEISVHETTDIKLKDGVENGVTDVKISGFSSEQDDEKESLKSAAHKEIDNFSKSLCLAVAYAANIGGTSTLIGTIPNMVLKGQVDGIYAARGLESPITFTSWMVFGVPCATICFILAWLWLQIFYFGIRSPCDCFCTQQKGNDDNALKEVIIKEYKKLGKIRFAEVANIIFFLLLVCLWITRKSEFFTGWGQLSIFKPGYVSDAVAALFVVVLLFAFPSKMPRMICCRKQNNEVITVPSLLNWKVVHERLPWSVVLLLGGGFALADVCQKSGLSLLIGKQFNGLGILQGWLIVFIIVIMIAALTEIMSNTAITTVFLPILYGVSHSLSIHPLYLMLPATVAASFAFMLPIATAPNAIVFAYGHLKVIDMAKAGLPLNIMCILVVMLATHTWGNAYFHMSTLPWGNRTDIGMP